MAHIRDLTPDPVNRRKHNPRNVGMLVDSLQRVGAARSIVIDEDGVVLAGNATIEAAAEAGITNLQIVDGDGSTLIAVRRSGLTDDQKLALALYDNRVAELATWDVDQLRRDVDAGRDLKPFFFDQELRALQVTGVRRGATDPDDLPAERETTIKRGDVFACGRHRVMCGDATQAADVERLIAGDDVDLVLTDPPYCSGGFQEAGKAHGSIGTRADDMIHNDTLSTRGYLALMKAAIGNVPARGAYVFTDWRMWIHLFDAMESSGYGVRNMVVWDKTSPGMGQGWRMQHELVMAAMTSRAPHFDPHCSQGNVIQSKRTGNELHPTQKPVDLLEAILRVTSWARVVVDPFGGAGSTLIACESSERACRLLELSPTFCQVAIDRWESYAGARAIRLDAAPAA